MNLIALLFGSIFGFLAVVFGAFGAHLLKNKLTIAQLQSFETGVKYQFYHAIVLLILGFQPTTLLNTNLTVSLFVIGTILFSFSIYGLVLLSARNKKLALLGPITPIGGLVLLLGWGVLIYQVLERLLMNI